MAIGRSYWGAAGTEPNQFAGWSEERKRFFEKHGYDRGPTPPETTVKVTETPPDDPTPTTRVTTTKYPEGMEQPGMQGDPYAGLLAPESLAPVAVEQGDTMMGEGNILQRKRGQRTLDADPMAADPLAEKAEFMGRREEQYEAFGSPAQVSIARSLGLPVDLLTAGINALIRSMGGPDTLIDDPIMGSQWLMDNRGWTLEDLGAATKDALSATGEVIEKAPETLWPGQSELVGPDRSGGVPTISDTQADDSVAEQANTTPSLLVDQFEESEGQRGAGGLLMGDDPTWGSGELEDVAGQDVGEMKEELDRYYDYFPEDIDAKRDRYLKGLKEIYKKVAILNVIAALTNSPSQAGAFMQMAAEKFKALEGFRGEERLQKIAKGVFFTEDGKFDAPQSKQDAFNRAVRFGASHEEALALSGHRKEYAPTTTAPPGYVTWNRTDPDTGEMIEESFRKGVHPRDLGYGEGWSVGQGKAPTEPAWYRSMQRIETTLRSYGRDAAIDELIWFWGSDPWFRMVFGEELEEQAALHVDKILAGRTPSLPTEGGATEQVVTPRSIKQAGA